MTELRENKALSLAIVEIEKSRALAEQPCQIHGDHRHRWVSRFGLLTGRTYYTCDCNAMKFTEKSAA
jgi:hypothetical protein